MEPHAMPTTILKESFLTDHEVHAHACTMCLVQPANVAMSFCILLGDMANLVIDDLYQKVVQDLEMGINICPFASLVSLLFMQFVYNIAIIIHDCSLYVPYFLDQTPSSNSRR